MTMNSKLTSFVYKARLLGNENAPDLIKTSLEDKLEIYLNYAARENEREIKIIGFGKWKNFENEL